MSKTSSPPRDNDATKEQHNVTPTCGIIMPLSDVPDYKSGHWEDVRSIIFQVVESINFIPNLVSDNDAIGLIHERIVTNLYENEIVICDVSSKNPNVMFELGLRLAFDKPTIILKDEQTDYTFDTGVIEHLVYPHTLRYNDIVLFKDKLSKKLKATYDKSKESDNYSPFLKAFGRTIKPSSISKKEVSETNYIIEELGVIRQFMQNLSPKMASKARTRENFFNNEINSFNINLYKDIEGIRREYTREQAKEIFGIVESLIDENPKLNVKEVNELFNSILKSIGIDYNETTFTKFFNLHLKSKRLDVLGDIF